MNQSILQKISSKNIHSFFHLISLICIAIIVYYPALSNDFIYLWDDQWQVFCATTEDGFTWINLRQIFTQPFYNQYFPLNQFFYMIVFTLDSSYNPFLFHIFCLCLHIGNVLLVYFLLIKILILSKRMPSNKAYLISFFTALLFAIHPLNVESVAWISASKILVYTFFFLLSLYSYSVYIEKKKIGYFLCALLMFLLSFGGKEQAVILPASLLILDWLVQRNLKNKELWFEKIPFVLLAVLMSLITLYVSHNSLSFGNKEYTLIERSLFCCYSYIEYLFKWIIPLKLLYLYPFPFLPGETIPSWLYLYPLLLLIIFISFRKTFITQWPLSFGLLWFFANLFMSVHIIPMPRFAIIADRYIYISSIGLSFIAAYYLINMYIQYKHYRLYFISLFIGISIYLGGYANIRTRVWHDSDSLKKEVRELIDQRNKYCLPQSDKKIKEVNKN